MNEQRVSDEQLRGLESMTLPPTMTADIIHDLLAARAEIERLNDECNRLGRMHLAALDEVTKAERELLRARGALMRIVACRCTSDIQTDSREGPEWFIIADSALRSLAAKEGK